MFFDIIWIISRFKAGFNAMNGKRNHGGKQNARQAVGKPNANTQSVVYSTDCSVSVKLLFIGDAVSYCNKY